MSDANAITINLSAAPVQTTAVQTTSHNSSETESIEGLSSVTSLASAIVDAGSSSEPSMDDRQKQRAPPGGGGGGGGGVVSPKAREERM